VFVSESGRARRFAAPPNGGLCVSVSLWLIASVFSQQLCVGLV
jgi:hypothetical protein